jgi:hypothetical protein
MKTHELKCWPEFFSLIVNGIKTFDLRRDDRGYEVGDLLVLREYDQVSQRYNRDHTVRVDYILRDFAGLMPGYCILSIKPVQP